eukprot:1250050-Amphidinium_carterae.1
MPHGFWIAAQETIPSELVNYWAASPSSLHLSQLLKNAVRLTEFPHELRCFHKIELPEICHN